jgi:uncharacterized spore protein YtfJ
MSFRDTLDTMTDRITASANARMVFGEPIVAGEKTVVPVAKVAGGFGAGGISSESSPDQNGAGGGGGGFRATPMGIVEITAERTRFIPLRNTKSLLWGALGGFVLARLWRRR